MPLQSYQTPFFRSPLKSTALNARVSYTFSSCLYLYRYVPNLPIQLGLIIKMELSKLYQSLIFERLLNKKKKRLILRMTISSCN